MDLIPTERLALAPMTQAFLEACLKEDRLTATVLLGLRVPSDWFANRKLMELRCQQCREDARYAAWSLRAISLRGDDEMIGYIGFHTAPGAAYLAGYAPGGVELGYSIAPQHRRRGYATEALLGMMRWARRSHNVRCFVLSISPTNEPSLGLARKLGFLKIGEQMDEEDGREEIWLLEDERMFKALTD